MSVYLAKDDDPTNFTMKTGTTSYTQHQWYYLVYSVEMKSGMDSEIQFWMDDVNDGIQTFSNVFIIDDATYPIYIGSLRTANNGFAEKMKGFIYEMHFY